MCDVDVPKDSLNARVMAFHFFFFGRKTYNIFILLPAELNYKLNTDVNNFHSKINNK